MLNKREVYVMSIHKKDFANYRVTYGDEDVVVSYIHKYFRDDKQLEEIIPCSDSLKYPSSMRDLKVAFVYYQTNDSLSLVVDEIVTYSVDSNTMEHITAPTSMWSVIDKLNVLNDCKYFKNKLTKAIDVSFISETISRQVDEKDCKADTAQLSPPSVITKAIILLKEGSDIVEVTFDMFEQIVLSKRIIRSLNENELCLYRKTLVFLNQFFYEFMLIVKDNDSKNYLLELWGDGVIYSAKSVCDDKRTFTGLYLCENGINKIAIYDVQRAVTHFYAFDKDQKKRLIKSIYLVIDYDTVEIGYNIYSFLSRSGQLVSKYTHYV